LRSDPKQGSFAKAFWAKGERRSFLEVVCDGMARRGGRGPTGRAEEDPWGVGQDGGILVSRRPLSSPTPSIFPAIWLLLESIAVSSSET
jgi:hypothetical protein